MPGEPSRAGILAGTRLVHSAGSCIVPPAGAPMAPHLYTAQSTFGPTQRTLQWSFDLLNHPAVPPCGQSLAAILLRSGTAPPLCTSSAAEPAVWEAVHQTLSHGWQNEHCRCDCSGHTLSVSHASGNGILQSKQAARGKAIQLINCGSRKLHGTNSQFQSGATKT